MNLVTDSDYGNFVDAGVVGADRTLAIKLLRLMLPGMRGDFVYVDQNSRVLSNRLDLVSKVKFPKSSGSAVFRASSSSQRRIASYPPTGGSGGLYIRNYSQQGVNAMYGYATPPCDTSFQTGDTGNMYFNAIPAHRLEA